jgi:HK97 family phage portal protein
VPVLDNFRARIASWIARAQPTAEQLVADRMGGRSPRAVTGDAAMRHSAVWACRRLRGDLISTMPVDAYRRINGIQVEVAKPPMLVNPGGDRVDILEWMYSSQGDLDMYGNTFGIITERNALGLPARIDLQPVEQCTVLQRKGVLKYRICGTEYDPKDVWHERQFTVSGLPVGLSPIAYAAYGISGYLSAQQFAADWFASGGVPTAVLKNTAKVLNKPEATQVKTQFKAAVENHDIFVTGADWEYSMISVPANQTQFIEMMQFSVNDIARYLGCPGDVIDAAVSGQSITYASIDQRNLQLLIMNLQPAITRRERALSLWLPRGQFVKLNANAAVLRMDPKTRAEVVKMRIESRTLTPDEARGYENEQPLTEEQYAQFDRLWPAKAATPTGAKA